MGFSRPEYWSGLSFPSPGVFPTQGSNHVSCVSHIDRCVLYHWATWETPAQPYFWANKPPHVWSYPQTHPVHKHPDPCLSLPNSETRNMSRSTYSKRGRNELALGTQTRKPCDSGYERMCKPRQALCAHLVFPFMLLWFLWHRKSTLEQPCLLSSEYIKNED